jgi:hypothetical protein
MTAPNYMRIIVCQVCCLDHTAAFSFLSPGKKKALRAAAGLS